MTGTVSQERNQERNQDPGPEPAEADPESAANEASDEKISTGAREIGGRKGLEPTRYGDWEKNGRCIDF